MKRQLQFRSKVQIFHYIPFIRFNGLVSQLVSLDVNGFFGFGQFA